MNFYISCKKNDQWSFFHGRKDKIHEGASNEVNDQADTTVI